MAKVTLNCGNISCAFRGEESFVLNAYQDFISRFGTCADAAQAPTVGQDPDEAPLPKAEDNAAATQIPHAEAPQKEQAPAKMTNRSASARYRQTGVKNNQKGGLVMRNMSKAMELLREMLSCGNMELESLEDVGYDWHDVLDQLDWPDCDGISYDRLMRAVVDVGIIKLKEAIDDRICELEAVPNERDLSASEEEELTVLQILNPDEDIRCSFNGIDGHIWCEECGSLYRDYMMDEIKEFERNVGYGLTFS